MTDVDFLKSITDEERMMWGFYKEILKPHYKVLEIGSGWGLFSRFCMMCGIKNLTTIDKIPEPKHYGKNVAGYELNITRIVGDSKDVLKRIDSETADVVMVDGDHGYTGFESDLREALRIVKKGGMIIVDDVWHEKNFQNDYGITLALSRLAFEEDFSIAIHQFGHGIGLIQT